MFLFFLKALSIKISGKFFKGDIINIKNQNLDKILDRNINELSEDLIAEELPPGIENGDFVTNRLADDLRKWLITGNQKRIFPDLATFYGYGGLGVELKLLSDAQLNSIPDGEPIE